jgi:long-chain acyl-CoA synthetase
MMGLSQGIVSGSRVRSPGERDARSSRIAGGLSQLGIRAGDGVALLMRNDGAFLEASYAIMRLGAYAVPINWHIKGPEIAYILEDSFCRALRQIRDQFLIPARPM